MTDQRQITDIAQRFAILGDNVSSIYQIVVILAGQVHRVEELRDDIANPDTYQGELLTPTHVVDRIQSALDGTDRGDVV